MDTHSALNSFELDDDVQRVALPLSTASGELPPITEHPVHTSLSTPQPSTDPSPGTSVSDHTAMISEITPDLSKHLLLTYCVPERLGRKLNLHVV